MKKIFRLLILVGAVAIWQGCGTRTAENTTGTTDVAADTTALTTEETSAESDVKEIAASRRAALEKASVEKAEQRRLAAIELARTNPTFKDAAGRVVYNKAEIDPSFVGGNKAMKKYLRDNLKYPQNAQENEVEGTVFCDFIVDQGGNVREVVASDIVGEHVEVSLKQKL